MTIVLQRTFPRHCFAPLALTRSYYCIPTKKVQYFTSLSIIKRWCSIRVLFFRVCFIVSFLNRFIVISYFTLIAFYFSSSPCAKTFTSYYISVKKKTKWIKISAQGVGKLPMLLIIYHIYSGCILIENHIYIRVYLTLLMCFLTVTWKWIRN